MTRLPNTALMVLLLLSPLVLAPNVDAAEHRIGVGVHYWTALDDFVDDFDVDEDGLAYLLSYQYRPGGLVSFELDLEYFPDGFGGATDGTLSPQAYVLFGRGLYVGVGIGVSMSDDFQDDVSDLFYAARVGFNLTLLPRVVLDINANYRANAFDELDNFDSDAITLGASLRLKL